MRTLGRLLLFLTTLLVLPLAAAAIAIADLVWLVFGKRRLGADRRVDARAASIVIPNWNGRELLEKYLPSVIAAAGHSPENEIIVVDNGSTDGSADFLRERFPQVRVVALDRNLGFGGGSNAGVQAATNDVVVLLNSDMRVAPDFLAPLLEGFRDPRVFSVSCQIFFSDPERRREETGLTEGWWQEGGLRVRHRIDEAVRELYPCFYGGGGSCAFDRRKFLELGGFDAVLAPFYLEDADLGFRAWKRGWRVFYQPRSVVYHEHRGTIGRHFTARQIDAVYKKNFVLFAWKNIHGWRRLAGHFFFAAAGAGVSALAGGSLTRASAAGIWRAFTQLPGALRSRWRARSLAAVSDSEAFRRPLGGYSRDRFELAEGGVPERPSVLFVSPYPICPTVHGGAVFMYAAIQELARLCDVHLVCVLDRADQREAQEEVARLCASAEFLVRGPAPRLAGTALPHAVCEFASDDLRWLIHRQVYTRRIDVVQLEYTALAQYAERYGRIANVLFEHDIYFQSIARGRLVKAKAFYEYLRALRYELRALPRLDRVQVCHKENEAYLLSFLPKLAPRIQPGLRAGIDAASYRFEPRGREPFTMLFLGSFRHLPNQAALAWFVRAVLPRVVAQYPEARLVVVGSEMPPAYMLPRMEAVELRGRVEDVREPLARYAVFVCPVLGGSGVRVKLIEAFAAGIPVVSTPLGAEGLAREDGELCALARTDEEFAAHIVRLFRDPEAGIAMAERARREVETRWDMRALAPKLAESYREVLAEKRGHAVAEKAAVSG
jgi:GT2 family glycosyltransferase